MKLFLALLTFCTFVQSQALADDEASIHNMIVFGSHPTYVSHLPMYVHDVHRYQAVYEVTFGEEVDKNYAEKLAAAKIFGISPQEEFTMPSLKAGSSFPAKLHPGHPEQTESIDDVTVTIKKVVHFQPLLPQGGKRPAQLIYFPVGGFLVHLLTTPTKGLQTPPDQFDQVVQVRRVMKLGTLEEVAIPEGATVTFGPADTVANRLIVTPDSKNFARGKITTDTEAFEALVQISKENYLHTGGDVRVR